MRKEPLLLVSELSISLLCMLALTGCLVAPVRVTTRTTSPSGTKLLVPTSAPSVGVTTRDEIEERYREFKLESGEPTLFWGLFNKSNWAIIWGFGGPGGAAAGGQRIWDQYNVLAGFDENNVVKSFDLVSRNALVDQFGKMYRNRSLPPLDLSSPIEVHGTTPYPWTFTVDIELSSTEMKITKMEQPWVSHKKHYKPKPPVVASVPAAQIVKVNVGIPPENWDPGLKERPFNLILEFSQKTSLGKRPHFYVEPRSALTLVRWLEQIKTTTPQTAVAVPAQ